MTGTDVPIDTIFKIFNIFITIVILTLIIIPWREIKDIREIYFEDEKKLNNLTIFLLTISSFVFIILSFTAIYVFQSVTNINEFKYAEGVSTEFYYRLPINVKLLILANYLTSLSYFLIPLHFFYLAKRKLWLSSLCFIFSLNIVLYGLTFYSRWTVTHYILIYFSFLYILYGTLNIDFKRYAKILAITISLAFLFYFYFTTWERFSSDTIYASNIPTKAIVHDAVVYSYLDYLSQWYNNSIELLDSYDWETFAGQISLQPILCLLGHYGIINYSNLDYMVLRMDLWGDYWYKFNGLVAYSVYDYGYVISIILAICYFFSIIKLAPKDKRISIVNLLFLVLLIQLPLMAIFYSTVSIIIIPSLLLIPIYLYLRNTSKELPFN